MMLALCLQPWDVPSLFSSFDHNHTSFNDPWMYATGSVSELAIRSYLHSLMGASIIHHSE